MKKTNFKNIDWKEYPGNPVITAPLLTPLLADPTFLTPDESPDRLWHLFAHSIFGIHHHISTDGFKWKRIGQTLFLSLRPFIYKQGETYVLFYEKLTNIFRFPYYDSHLEARTSKDLVHWSKPKNILKPTLPWQICSPAKGTLGGVSVVKVKNKFKLFSAGGLRTVIDTFFCEPSKPGLAVADRLLGPYKQNKQPLSHNTDPNNLITINRVRTQPDGSFICLQTYYYQDKQSRSRCATRLMVSDNCNDWQTIKDPLIAPTKGWKRSHGYVGDIKEYKGEYRVYFNARDGWNWGSERIGLMIGKPKKTNK